MSKAFDAVTGAAVTGGAVTGGAHGAGAAASIPIGGPIGMLGRALSLVNRIVIVLGGVALVGACGVLSYSVLLRYLFKVPTVWQDETAVFLIVGATFLSAAAVQERRGHVAIEALASLLPDRVNQGRLVVVDAASLVFCGFFAWKSWVLLDEAWVDGQTSSSTWAPPLWIPYSLMSVGMTLLALQLALQIVDALLAGPLAAGWARPKIGIAADLDEGRAR